MSAAALFRRAAAAPRIARAFSTSPSHNVARMTIVGNLADSPELQTTSTGREVVRYSLASNTGPRDNRHTSWFRITSFEPEGPRRDFLQSLPKGSLLFVEGEATMSTFQDADGKNRNILNVIQRTVEVLKRPQTGTNPSE
ncbi:single-strand binding protein family [Colletotrichum graminicola]|uniref:Single-strand binding protein family n=1 Tax=Colletotrichum graminicola (strain M1.001 / M2 / FGSC 10212) TaxID=645133 RepID=E3QCN2_COLGM|nr:single-strand binding protein family [Colletotrichum graminicola M1.001]EFQ28620.1 single-strand binding protein family [Colletotrichum graminicola M1.001]WDK15868.1 single-strand binding protein family [Colletotrichum graminicola]